MLTKLFLESRKAAENLSLESALKNEWCDIFQVFCFVSRSSSSLASCISRKLDFSSQRLVVQSLNFFLIYWTKAVDIIDYIYTLEKRCFQKFFFHKLISTLFYNNIHSEDGNLSLLTLLIWLLIFSQFYFLFPKTLLLSWNYCLKSCQISIIKVVPLNPTSLYDALSLPPEMKKSFKQKMCT